MALPPLADALYVFVFGPGTGELVAVRAPPNDWLIVDGCGVGKTKYGPALLAHYGATPRMIALTHPHRDPPAPGWPDCYVLLSIAADGSTHVTPGPGSVQVRERATRARPRRRRRARS